MRFEFAPLTILTGLNGSGKTSLIHSLLLTREAAITPAGGVLSLNGPFGLELGTAEDIRNWNSNGSIQFVLSSAFGPQGTWQFVIPSEEALYVTVEPEPGTLPVAFSSLPRTFTYLCAERFGPRNTSGASPRPAAELEVGVRGEYCAQMLESIGDKLIKNDSRTHPAKKSEAALLLKYEVEKWLAEIARPVELDAILGVLVEVAEAAQVDVPMLSAVAALGRVHAQQAGLMPQAGR